MVSLAAPGDHILVFNTEAENEYYYVNGTSFAAPQVTGALVLLLAAFPNCTVLHIFTVQVSIFSFIRWAMAERDALKQTSLHTFYQTNP